MNRVLFTEVTKKKQPHKNTIISMNTSMQRLETWNRRQITWSGCFKWGCWQVGFREEGRYSVGCRSFAYTIFDTGTGSNSLSDSSLEEFRGWQKLEITLAAAHDHATLERARQRIKTWDINQVIPSSSRIKQFLSTNDIGMSIPVFAI